MLRILVGEEGFNDDTNEFVTMNPVVLELEHSLVSLSKWESRFMKPFLSAREHTPEEIWGYIESMVLNVDVDPETVRKINVRDLDRVQKYIDSPQSATTFGVMPEPNKGRGETITAELIYYWMVAFTIPWEAETWHLNRLFSLIRICNIKNSKPQKQSPHESAAQRARINKERRERLGTRG
jgi:hypothetical protein